MLISKRGCTAGRIVRIARRQPSATGKETPNDDDSRWFVVLIGQLSAEHAELLPCTDKLNVACIAERRRDR